MSKQTSPLVMIAAFLMGIGFFSVFYPIFTKLMSPARSWADYQSYLLAGGRHSSYHSLHPFSDRQI